MTERQKASLIGAALLIPVFYVLWIEGANCVVFEGRCGMFGMVLFIVFCIGSMMYLSQDMSE